jgi:hypothetical protein
MDSPSASGQGVPLQFVVIFLEVLDDLVGAHGTAALLRRAGHPEWIESPPHPAPESFASPESVTAIFSSLEELYGPRGGRGLGRRLGAAVVDRHLKDLGALAGVTNPTFQALPSRTRARVGLMALGRVVTGLGGFRLDVSATDQAIALSIPDCPFCVQRSLDAPGCAALVGLVDAALRLVAPEVALSSQETACRATGAAACELTVRLPATAS